MGESIVICSFSISGLKLYFLGNLSDCLLFAMHFNWHGNYNVLCEWIQYKYYYTLLFLTAEHLWLSGTLIVVIFWVANILFGNSNLNCRFLLVPVWMKPCAVKCAGSQRTLAETRPLRVFSQLDTNASDSARSTLPDVCYASSVLIAAHRTAPKWPWIRWLFSGFTTWDLNKVSEWLSRALIGFLFSLLGESEPSPSALRICLEELCRVFYPFEGSVQQGFSHYNSSPSSLCLCVSVQVCHRP